jgi:hypothetical protein
MTPEEEVKQILNEIGAIKPDENNKKDWAVSNERKEFSYRLLAIMKREFAYCTVTLSEFYMAAQYYDGGAMRIAIKVKITRSKAARIEVSWDGEPGSNIYSNQKWSTQVWDYYPERTTYTRKFGKDIEQNKDFPFADIKKYISDKVKDIVKDDGNIVPGIIRYLKKNLDPTITYKKAGVGNDSRWFKYDIKIFELEFSLKQDVNDIILRFEQPFKSSEREISTSLGDPRCFDNIRRDIIISAVTWYTMKIANIESTIKTKKQELILTKELVDKIDSMKEKI